MVMKIDLVKDYDQVDWSFLRLILMQIELNLEITNWIMGCVLFASFTVLVNSSPIVFFKASRGSR